MEGQNKKEKRDLNEKEEKILKDYIAERSDKEAPFTKKEIRLLIPKLKEVSDSQERSVGGVYMWLRKLSGKAPPPVPEKKVTGMDRIMEKVETHLKRIERCIKKELGRQFSIEKKKREMAEKEREVYKNRIRYVEEELRRLKLIKEAVETVQQQEARFRIK